MGMADDYQAALAALRRGEGTAGRDLLLSCVAQRPDDAQAWLFLGVAHGQLGDLQAAEEALRHSLRLEPDDPRTHYNLGRLHHRRGESALAVAAYRQALALEPAFARASEALVELGESAPPPPPSRPELPTDRWQLARVEVGSYLFTMAVRAPLLALCVAALRLALSAAAHQRPADGQEARAFAVAVFAVPVAALVMVLWNSSVGLFGPVGVVAERAGEDWVVRRVEAVRAALIGAFARTAVAAVGLPVLLFITGALVAGRTGGPPGAVVGGFLAVGSLLTLPFVFAIYWLHGWLKWTIYNGLASRTGGVRAQLAWEADGRVSMGCVRSPLAALTWFLMQLPAAGVALLLMATRHHRVAGSEFSWTTALPWLIVPWLDPLLYNAAAWLTGGIALRVRPEEA